MTRPVLAEPARRDDSAMPGPNVRYDLDRGLATITLARPDAGNAMDAGLARELLAVSVRCASDPGVRAVLVVGEGRNFCVGGDLRAFTAQGDPLPQHLREVTSHLHAGLAHLARMDAPVVAAVQGSAAGAGMSLACAADLVVMGESARMLMAYTRIGLSPDGSGTWHLPRIVGLRRALDLTLNNRPVSAAEALAWGLATSVVPDAEVQAAATAMARSLADGPTRALGSAKRLLHDSLDRTLETQLEHETIELCANAATADAREGIAAFFEKRAARFQGA